MTEFTNTTEIRELMDRGHHLLQNYKKSYDLQTNSEDDSNTDRLKESNSGSVSFNTSRKNSNTKDSAFTGAFDILNPNVKSVSISSGSINISAKVFARCESSESKDDTPTPTVLQRREYEQYLEDIKSNEQYHASLLSHMKIQKNEHINRLVFSAMENMKGRGSLNKADSILYSAEKQPGDTLKKSLNSVFKSPKPNGNTQVIEQKAFENSLILNTPYLSQMPHFFSSIYEHFHKNTPQKELSINYIQQIQLLSLANNTIFQQIQNLEKEKVELLEKCENLESVQIKRLDNKRISAEKKEEEYSGMSLFEKKKRHRRTALEIERPFSCPVGPCYRLYGSEGSLNQHIKQKHPEYYYKGEIMKDPIKAHGNRFILQSSIEKKEDRIVVSAGMPMSSEEQPKSII